MAPPSSLASREDFLARVDDYNHHVRQSFARGICPSCVNALDTEFLDPDETGFGDSARREVYVYRRGRASASGLDPEGEARQHV